MKKDYWSHDVYMLHGFPPPEDDSMWVNPSCRRTKNEYPYSYSEFFLFGDRSTAAEAKDALYSDRIWQWKREKADACWKEHVNQRWQHVGPQKLSAFLSAYLGKPVRALAMAEGCNVSNGYPYWVVWLSPEATTAVEDALVGTPEGVNPK